MRALGKVTSKGQITIPREVRDSLGVDPGDTLEFTQRADGVVELRRSVRGDALALFGRLEPAAPLTVRQMDEGIDQALAADVAARARR